MCPRYRLTIHKKNRFLRMRTCHKAVMPSTHTTVAGKTARRWIEEQVKSRCRAERPAQYSDTAAVGGNTGPAAPYSLHKTH
ncbi:unnamed protein product [Staurois parvus]|uniref:Uncharacterized protein n=1 Tax=Staurois parvus TaxID=386267 RepID=A0ABN9DCP7_9NEOB|nr:unnamed protein product [Staurois parvus]